MITIISLYFTPFLLKAQQITPGTIAPGTMHNRYNCTILTKIS